MNNLFGYTEIQTIKPEECYRAQKTIYGDDGKKLYFITIVHEHYGYKTAEVNMYTQTSSFVVCLSIEDKTTKEVEEFFAGMYSKLGCIPDIHNNLR